MSNTEKSVRISRIGSRSLTEANQIRIRTLHKEAKSWRVLGELVAQAAKEEGVDHPSAEAAAQTVRAAAQGKPVSEWSVSYILAALNHLNSGPSNDDTSAESTTKTSAERVGEPDWEAKYEEKRQENVRLTGELRAAKLHSDSLHKELEETRLDLQGVRGDMEEMLMLITDLVLSEPDESGMIVAQNKAAKYVIARQISEA